MKTTKLTLILLVTGILVTLSFVSGGYSQEVLSAGRSYRSLAMGNTGIASANDSAAIFYNPAMLANVEGWWIDLAAWTVEISDGFTPVESAIMLVSPTFPYVNRNGIDDTAKDTFLSKTNPYLRASAGISLAANIMSEGLGIGGAYMIENIMTTSEAGANIYQRDDLIKKIGVSIPIGMGQFVIGVTRNDIIRRVADDPSTDSVPNWSDYYLGTGYDVGLLYRMANKARLTWGLVIYNYGGTDYGDYDESGLRDEQSYGFGVSSNHELGFFRLVLAADVREINSSGVRQNTTHLGMEIGMFPNSTGGSYLTYRVGANQGYTTQGAELNLFNRSMIFGYAVYGEEVGQENEKVESRRTVYYFSMGF